MYSANTFDLFVMVENKSFLNKSNDSAAAVRMERSSSLSRRNSENHSWFIVKLCRRNENAP